MRRRARPADGIGHASQIYGLISLLMEYPGPDLLAARDDLAAVAESLPDSPAAARVARFARHFAAGRVGTLESAYVETFDLRRRTTLHLTYGEFGETRQRGAALVVLKQRYRLAGLVPPESELPDYLPLLAEFASRSPEAGQAALASCHVGLELLDRALDGSPYRDLTAACGLMLGRLSSQGRERVDSLVMSGPPMEQVGTGS
ncbi:MAG: nitrate reductase molybdenum cofactor assembly chaperone [Bifidobacteriaceae bacterium]|jgi:nitrate reductase delta subunit|nr:nitrate reductase molybdenum cofactor assembly chaperone [Bifidobacteriaceae bacterium]